MGAIVWKPLIVKQSRCNSARIKYTCKPVVELHFVWIRLLCSLLIRYCFYACQIYNYRTMQKIGCMIFELHSNLVHLSLSHRSLKLAHLCICFSINYRSYGRVPRVKVNKTNEHTTKTRHHIPCVVSFHSSVFPDTLRMYSGDGWVAFVLPGNGIWSVFVCGTHFGMECCPVL